MPRPNRRTPDPYVMLNPTNGHSALRRGRYSSPHAEYFLTLCTHEKISGLTHPPLAPIIRDQWQHLEAQNHWHVRTAVIMPDHIHMLITLGENSELPSIIRLFKGRLAASLRQNEMQWQRGYFDHRLRPDDDQLPLFLYIYLNPYRANLIQRGQVYAHYYCQPSDWAWFQPLTNENLPFPEWLS